MQKNRISGMSRILLFIGSLALVTVLFVPMWRIDLDAPQYPEGLRLQIHPDKLGGDVEIINGLNHYIGMKTLHTEDFIEFKLLPFIIVLFALLFAIVGLKASRKWLHVLLALFILFGVVAMVDFWRWEYNYGHNLDPNAAIVVPGMAYQPPLIGFKQLLNFGAYSIPDIGGWLFITAGIILLLATILEWKRHKRYSSSSLSVNGFLCLFILLLSSCRQGPEPIRLGEDQCHFCKMTISDNRFSAELVTDKGKVYKFDDVECLLSFRKSGFLDQKNIRELYVSNYSGIHQLIPLSKSLLLQSDALRSPMGGNIAAFDHSDSLRAVQKIFPGKQLSAGELLQP